MRGRPCGAGSDWFVCVSQGVGVFWVLRWWLDPDSFWRWWDEFESVWRWLLELASFCTERTIVLSFSVVLVSTARGTPHTTPMAALTQVKHIASAASVQSQGRVARRAVLRLEFADVLVEAGLVRHMPTRELQDTLSTQRVLQRLLTYGAFATNRVSDLQSHVASEREPTCQ